MKPVMYLFLNRAAGMSTGKAAAQAAHAAVEAYLATPDSNLKRVWHRGGHCTKIVLAADDETHLHTIQRYLWDRGFESCLIVDEGRTEVRPYTATALGVEIVDKDHAHAEATFSSFSLYPPSVELVVLEGADRVRPATFERARQLAADGQLEKAKLVLQFEAQPARSRPQRFLNGKVWRRR